MSLPLPGSLGTKSKAVRGAYQFAEVLGRVVNCTISKAPIRAAVVQEEPLEGYIACLTQDHLPSLVPLTNGCFLYMDHRFGLAMKNDKRFLATTGYTYTYQLDRSDETWMVRWEYNRHPEDGYPYPHSHVHVNACPKHYAGDKPFCDLHIPTARLPLEAIVQHLIVEHGIQPISDTWQDTLGETQAEFERIQALRFAD